jgi:SPX domain protein involved in polyphosphate accumulation
MVQFGKRLKQISEANDKFTSYYLDYKSLKNALNVITDASASVATLANDGNPTNDDTAAGEAEHDPQELADAEERFVLALEGEFAKVESFFRRTVAEMASEFKSLCKRAAALPPVPPRAPAAAAAVHNMNALMDHLAAAVEKHHHAMAQALLDFAGNLDDVRGYVMTNAQVCLCASPNRIAYYWHTSSCGVREFERHD